MAQSLGLNFSGSNSDLTTLVPADPAGAVNADHYVEFVKGRFAVYRKSDGVAVTSSTDAAFWTGAGVNPGAGNLLSYPRVIFDPSSKRWFVSQIDVIGGTISNTNNLLLAVSNSADPTAGFKAFKLDPNSNFADYATLGLDADGVYMATNNYDTSSFAYLNGSILSIPKADLLNATTPNLPASRTLFSPVDGSTVGFGIQPAIDFGASKGHGSLLAVDVDSFGVLDKTNINNVTGPGAATLSATNFLVVPVTNDPNPGRQPDGTANLDTGEDTVSGSVYRVGNTLWACHNIGENGATEIRWYKIDDTTGAVLQSGTIGDSAHDLFFPSICANANGDVVIGFSRSGPAAGEYVSSYAAVGTTVAGITTFGGPFSLKNGAGDYHVGTHNRWGAYSTTAPDPCDPQVFWTIQTYASATNKWSTQISEVIVPLPGEVRWLANVNGNFTPGANWLNGIGPVSPTSDVIFSRATNPAGSGYTVTFDASSTNKSLSVRQGKVTFNLNAKTFALLDTSSTSPSLRIGEFFGSSQLTLMNGTLSSVNASLAASPDATATLIVGPAGAPAATWNASGSVYVGGTSAAQGGTGSLQLLSNGTIQIGGTLQVWPAGTVALGGGTLTAGNIQLAGGTINCSVATSLSSPLATSGGSIINTAPLSLGGSFSIASGATLTKSGAGTLTITGSQSHAAGATLTVSAGTLNLNSNAGSPAAANLNLLANAPTTFGSTQNLKSLSVGAGVTAAVASGGGKVLVTGALTLAGGTDAWTSKLDLADNDLVVRSTAASRSADASRIANQIKQGFNIAGTKWSGNGITSSLGGDGASSFHALGIAANDRLLAGGGSPGPLYTSFDGQSVGVNDILVKYTWFGDADLSGSVNSNDYFQIDAGFIAHRTGWINGDFDYNGIINSNDYFLIDTAFAKQNTVPAPAPSGSSSTITSVPEPASIALSTTAALSLPRRRRRRA